MDTFNSLYINNAWVEGKGPQHTSYNPATGEKIWEAATADHNDVDLAVKSASQAFPEWSSTPLSERTARILQFRELIDKNKKELATTLSRDNGKPLWDATNEIQSMLSKIDISLAAYEVRCPSMTKKRENKQIVLHHAPHGVAAVFGPFNFPAHLPNGHFIPALLAGNTIVFKPSELTPLISDHIIRLWEQVDLPTGVINMVQGGPSTGKFLANHPAIDALFFTGSWATGQLLAELFSKKVGKILALEMGGNNPLIVSSVSNLQAAAYITLQSAFLTTGQRCTCARRLIVPIGDNGDVFLAELVKMTKRIKVGAFHETPEPFMGPVISEAAADRLLSGQEALKNQGGIPLLQMERLPLGKAFLSPGIMDVTAISSRKDEEYFGPFLQVIRVKNFPEALEKAKETDYGLTVGLLSDNPNEFHTLSRSIKAGIFCWNAPMTGVEGSMPFGGTGKSGNFRPTAFYAADYCAYPVTSIEGDALKMPENLTPGIN